MRVWYSLVSIILVFVCMMRANGQEIRRAEVAIDFRVNRVVLDTLWFRLSGRQLSTQPSSGTGASANLGAVDS